MMDIRQAKLGYLVSVIGVALMTGSNALGVSRTTFRPDGGLGGNRQFGNITLGNATAIGPVNQGPLNQGSMNPLGLTDTLAIIGVIIAIVGFAWLGIALLQLKKAETPNKASQPTE
jgi:hypothetical protein